MSYSIEPAFTVTKELSRQLIKVSTQAKNQWFFPEGGFSSNSLDHIGDMWVHENFVVISDTEIIAYFEGQWARPLNILLNFRLILLDEKKSFFACKAFFQYLEYLFVSRGCDVFNWSVATENRHAYLLYEKFVKKNCGHIVGRRTRSLQSYCGKISDSVLYEISKEEYFDWKDSNQRK
ncbi:MAG: hypothetical protein BKP49_04320 [Treponema sp. CETP13]|nr:MAG: hypothetical protein BKP49_04320 [Treponema sp. CETP13]